MLTFAHVWLFALLPLPWLVRAALPPRRVRELAVRIPFGDRLRAAASGSGAVASAATAARRGVARALVWAALVTALARPQWLEPPVRRELPMRDLLLLVDLSGSMQQEDFADANGGRIGRLVAVKQVLGDFLLRRDGDRVGLVVFGEAPFLQVPFSADLSLARRLLDEAQIGMAGPRTAFGDAIGLGISLFERSDAVAKTLIALTDGNDTHSQVPPVEAARIARERGVRVHTVAIGDPTTVGEDPLDEATLRAVAETGGGSYFFAADRAQLEGIYAELDRIETRQVEVQSYRPRRDVWHWPVLVALFASLAAAWSVTVRAPVDEGAAAPGSVRVDPVTGRLEVVS